MIKIVILFLIYSLTGTLLHFLFKLSKNNIIVGIFASVNESVWEHIKILLTPIFMISFISFLCTRNYNFFILLMELLTSIILIILLYEIKLHFFKEKYNFINIVIFYVVSFIISYIHFKLQNYNVSNLINGISLIMVIIVFIMYLTFTIFPLKNKYFKDPINGTFGINEYVNKSV